MVVRYCLDLPFGGVHVVDLEGASSILDTVKCVGVARTESDEVDVDEYDMDVESLSRCR